MLRSPNGITDFMGETSPTPVMNYNLPFIPIEENMILPDIPLTPTENISMSILNGVRVEFLQMNAFDTKCTGYFCRKVGIYENGQTKSHCACTATKKNVSTAGVAWYLKITTRDNEDIYIRDFSNSKFNFDFIFADKFPAFVKACHLDDLDVSENTLDAAERVFNEVNMFGGWTAILWQKQGMVEDAVAKQANSGTYNAAPVYVASGTMLHHLVHLAPTRPNSLNPVRMKGFKVNITN